MTNEQPDRPIPQYDRSTNEQDRFLDYCQRNQILITVYLDSGRALQGKIVDHDRKCLLLGATRQEKIPKLIPKSYVALVRAEEILPLFLEYKGRGNHLTRRKARKAKRKAEREANPPTAPVRKIRAAKTPVAMKTNEDTPGKTAAPVKVLIKKAPRSKSLVPKKKNPSSPSEDQDADGNS
ncbi:RNA chaperone Hfq [Pseudomonas mosselii]|uniref:RNA chaperone Hfq n=1 Tax=Pseudomonas mosselii TaxID=78327 RepID=UPI0021D95ECA|nr:RNA chaperone Hfq [Pseudomonas mosselii]MCU9528359.1 RNA chaperone Hfq [Pseudomonas mosselii]MCU9535532.1 RNA chaperone Hfq [Pseudomonas mosselii]MCU9547383.1 RNA chaperone Hfq [Pseudomonas mosselii]